MDTNMDQIPSTPIQKLKKYVLEIYPNISEELLAVLASDPRKSARHIAKLVLDRRMMDLREQRRLEEMLHYEKELYGKGYHLIAGVDEAGVAPLAGPVVAAAVILPQNYVLDGLNDSKKILDRIKREKLAQQIKRDSICWATGSADVEEIDRLNVYRASLLAMTRALEGLSKNPEYILVDARTVPHCSVPQKSITHGDALSASIAAASLIAKTTRDTHMIAMDTIYSGYGFSSHKGYPTQKHLEALKRLGPLPIHRKSFAPVRKIIQTDPLQQSLFPNSSTVFRPGRP